MACRCNRRFVPAAGGGRQVVVPRDRDDIRTDDRRSDTLVHGTGLLRHRVAEDLRRIAVLRTMPGTAQTVDRCLRRVQAVASYVAVNYGVVI